MWVEDMILASMILSFSRMDQCSTHQPLQIIHIQEVGAPLELMRLPEALNTIMLETLTTAALDELTISEYNADN